MPPIEGIWPVIQFKSDWQLRLAELLTRAQVSLPNRIEIEAIFLADVVLNNTEYTQDDRNGFLRWAT